MQNLNINFTSGKNSECSCNEAVLNKKNLTANISKKPYVSMLHALHDQIKKRFDNVEISKDHDFDHVIQFFDCDEVRENANLLAGDCREKENLKKKQEKIERNIELLTQDQYYPGLIDDAVNHRVNFNKVAFELYFGDEVPDNEPEIFPLTLLEAFDLRLQQEQCSNIAWGKKSTKKKKCPSNTYSENIKKSKAVNREEIVVANAMEVELAEIVKNKPKNDLSNAIISLIKAEVMNDYDKRLEAAEEAYQKAPPDTAESAAVYKANTFKAEQITKQEAQLKMLQKNYRPIEIVSYMGITKPSDENSLNTNICFE